ncbi:MAG: PLP-dependent transferase [Gemmatimonadota bacterium]
MVRDAGPSGPPPHLHTRAVHAGGYPDAATGAISPPIQLSTTFEHGPEAEIPGGFLYIRDGNPADSRLEEAIADLESGAEACVFASGMAATAAAIQTLPEHAHVVMHADLYGGVHSLAREFMPGWGMSATIADLRDPEAIQSAMTPQTRAVWIETPSNPLVEILDIRKLARIAHEAGAELIVDNTFATPILQRPLELGADIVMHSTTKFMGGHSDVQGGALVFAEAGGRADSVRRARQLVGGVASPFNSWLVLRGLRTLACRVERQSANAFVIASALDSHASVGIVHYPGLEAHPGHEVAARQMSAFGGVLSVELADGRQAALSTASNLRLIKNATSLGGVETLLEHRASVQGPHTAVPQNLLRISVGLEHPDDLLADLRQALDRE